MRTQVGIVGAGPAGLTLAQLLHREGIESVVLEDRTRDYVEHRVRAGVLEQGTVDLLTDIGVGERLAREGLVHHGIEIQFDGERHRIPLTELTGGRTIVIYGQTEVVKDLIEVRLYADLPLLFEAADVSLHELESKLPRIRFTHEGATQELECDLIAGCDGFHARPLAARRSAVAGAVPQPCGLLKPKMAVSGPGSKSVRRIGSNAKRRSCCKVGQSGLAWPNELTQGPGW